MISAILGKKLGMTQIFDDEGRRVPVTIIHAGPCRVLQVRTPKRDGYSAVQLGFDEKREKLTTKPMLGHFARTGAPPQRFIREIRLPEGEAPGVEEGDEIRVGVLDEVQLVDVQGRSKGKGFAGGMKRWNFGGGRASHGASKSHRTLGSIGRTYSTSKGVPKGKKMPGHLGDETVSVLALRLVRVDPERNLLLIMGAVPGPNGGYLVIRRSKRKAGRGEAQVADAP